MGKVLQSAPPGPYSQGFIFPHNSQIGPMSKSVCHWQAFPAQCYVTLLLIGHIESYLKVWALESKNCLKHSNLWYISALILTYHPSAMSKIISLQINAVVLITFLSTILLHLLALLNGTLQRTLNYHGKRIIASTLGIVFTRIHISSKLTNWTNE